VVTDHLLESGLLPFLEQMKFNVFGYGCTSCIGNSEPLPDTIASAVQEHDLILGAALSSNRNFEARIHPHVKMNFLMSPLLVVAYAIAGRMDIDMLEEPLAYDKSGKGIYLRDVWPSEKEIQETVNRVLKKEHYRKNYAEIFEGNEQWKQLEAPETKAYVWDPASTYVKEAPFFVNLPDTPGPIQPIQHARVLLLLGDSVTTDHISPAGSFNNASSAGKYLVDRGIPQAEFNSYGSRRGNDEVMVRGTFANIRIKNKLVAKEGGFTAHLPTDEVMSVYDAAMKYKEEKTPLLVIAGKEYGSGSSRAWAAKGTFLLGIKAVIAESYERIHRSNLGGMGVLPLQFLEGEHAAKLGLTGTEDFHIADLNDNIQPFQHLFISAERPDKSSTNFEVVCRLDSKIEIEYYRNNGILQYMLRQFLTEKN